MNFLLFFESSRALFLLFTSAARFYWNRTQLGSDDDNDEDLSWTFLFAGCSLFLSPSILIHFHSSSVSGIRNGTRRSILKIPYPEWKSLTDTVALLCENGLVCLMMVQMSAKWSAVAMTTTTTTMGEGGRRRQKEAAKKSLKQIVMEGEKNLI